MATTRRNNSLPDDLRRKLDEAHRALLRVHKALIDHERTRYERVRGPISGPGEFLQILIGDPWFAWLRPVSELAVQIDEYTISKDPVDPAAGEALLEQAKALLRPEEGNEAFAGGYYRALQDSPEVSAAHGEWRQWVVATERKQ
jgi:hypothetical protein